MSKTYTIVVTKRGIEVICEGLRALTNNLLEEFDQKASQKAAWIEELGYTIERTVLAEDGDTDDSHNQRASDALVAQRSGSTRLGEVDSSSRLLAKVDGSGDDCSDD